MSFKKTEREQLDVIRTELARHGVTELRVVQRRRHKQVFWPGGSCAVSGSPSDCMGLMALRALVRRQCRRAG